MVALLVAGGVPQSDQESYVILIHAVGKQEDAEKQKEWESDDTIRFVHGKQNNGFVAMSTRWVNM